MSPFLIADSGAFFQTLSNAVPRVAASVNARVSLPVFIGSGANLS